MAEPGDPKLVEVLASQHTGVLATIKRDGRPQLSVVSYDYDPSTHAARISTTETTAKTRNLRRDPRASLHVSLSGYRGYAVAEADAEVSPTAAEAHDPTVEELIDVYRAVAGEHPDWDEYRAAMVADRRVVVRLRVTRIYGWAS